MDCHPTTSELAELVDGYFDDNDIDASYDPEQGMGKANGAVFSTHNLAANLARIDRSDWPGYVAWHFSHLVEGPPQIPVDYTRARKRLRVRLASTAWVDQLPSQEITRPVADDLHQVLMVNIDGGASTVPPESLATWGNDIDAIWDDARKNTMLDEPRERRSMLKRTGERLTWIRGS